MFSLFFPWLCELGFSLGELGSETKVTEPHKQGYRQEAWEQRDKQTWPETNPGAQRIEGDAKKKMLRIIYKKHAFSSPLYNIGSGGGLEEQFIHWTFNPRVKPDTDLRWQDGNPYLPLSTQV